MFLLLDKIYNTAIISADKDHNKSNLNSLVKLKCIIFCLCYYDKIQYL